MLPARLCIGPSPTPHCPDWGSSCHRCHHHHVSVRGPNGGGDIQGLPKNMTTSVLGQLRACMQPTVHVQIKTACADVEVLQTWCQGQGTVTGA